MIKITIELIPNGDEKSPNRRVLGTMKIANDGTGSETVGNYDGILFAEYTGKEGRTGRVEGFMRKRQSVWSLIGAFLKLWGHTTHSPQRLFKTNTPALFQ